MLNTPQWASLRASAALLDELVAERLRLELEEERVAGAEVARLATSETAAKELGPISPPDADRRGRIEQFRDDLVAAMGLIQGWVTVAGIELTAPRPNDPAERSTPWDDARTDSTANAYEEGRTAAAEATAAMVRVAVRIMSDRPDDARRIAFQLSLSGAEPFRAIAASIVERADVRAAELALQGGRYKFALDLVSRISTLPDDDSRLLIGALEGYARRLVSDPQQSNVLQDLVDTWITRNPHPSLAASAAEALVRLADGMVRHRPDDARRLANRLTHDTPGSSQSLAAAVAEEATGRVNSLRSIGALIAARANVLHATQALAEGHSSEALDRLERIESFSYEGEQILAAALNAEVTNLLEGQQIEAAGDLVERWVARSRDGGGTLADLRRRVLLAEAGGGTLADLRRRVLLAEARALFATNSGHDRLRAILNRADGTVIIRSASDGLPDLEWHTLLITHNSLPHYDEVSNMSLSHSGERVSFSHGKAASLYESHSQLLLCDVPMDRGPALDEHGRLMAVWSWTKALSRKTDKLFLQAWADDGSLAFEKSYPPGFDVIGELALNVRADLIAAVSEKNKFEGQKYVPVRQRLWMWRLGTGEHVATVDLGNSGHVTAMKVLDNGSIILATSMGYLLSVPSDSADVVRSLSLGLGVAITSIDVRLSGVTAFAGIGSNGRLVWGQVGRETRLVHDEPTVSAGATSVAVEGDFVASALGSQLRLFRLSTGREITGPTLKDPGPASYFSTVAASGSGRVIAASVNHGPIRIWSAKT